MFSQSTIDPPLFLFDSYIIRGIDIKSFSGHFATKTKSHLCHKNKKVPS